jgi:D-alanyl-D-alanine carboxypeptidase (penicillin-binding protein 5/6)
MVHPGLQRARRIGRLMVVAFCMAAFAGGVATAEPVTPIDIKAREYILVDFQTGTVLDAKNADEHMPPSSMSKLMTTYLTLQALKSGKLSMTDELTVSQKAWKMGGAASGGSTMFLNPGDKVKVEDLLRGMIIQSGNDACIVLAEGISGSEEAFADEMNKQAKALGLSNSHFVNATGLPSEQHYMTARDLATLARHLIVDFPEFYPVFSETSFTYNNITQGNRNPLLYRLGSGADGLKTGHTEIAGYGLTGSAIRNGRRLILVANGMASIHDRDEETSKLLDWGFREFVNRELFKAGDVVSEADVWLGDTSTVPLAIASDVVVTVPRPAAQSLEARAVYDGPLPAPIKQGAAVGKVVVTGSDISPIEVPLVAANAVGRLGLVGRLKTAAYYIFLGPPKSNVQAADKAPAPAPATPAAPAKPAQP